MSTQRELLNDFDFSSSFDNDEVDDNDNQLRQFKSVENIDYFDFDYENAENTFIVIVDKHVFYRNIYVFVDRLKNLIKLSMINAVKRVREFVFFCFREKTLIWYFIELNDFY